MGVGNAKLWRLLTVPTVILAVLSFTLSGLAQTYAPVINDVLRIKTSQQVDGANASDSCYFQSSYGSLEEMYQAKIALIREIAQEGTILLKNEGNTLPLSGGTIIVLGGDNLAVSTSSGGGSMNGGANKANMYDHYTTLEEALSYDGLTVKTDASAASSADSVLVVLGRVGGEGYDLELDQKNHTGSLALTSEELAIIDTAKSCGAGKVIVLLTGDYSIEVDELAKDEGIGAIVRFGNVGYRGTYGIADVITGKVSPSGKLVETMAVSSYSSPAMQNFGDYKYENAMSIMASAAQNYVAYMEGIYVDYKYYETRYEDCILGKGGADSISGAFTSRGGWNWAEEVTYPYGYGLSYTTFTKELAEEPSFDNENHTATISVKVTNTGDVAGKEVVQVYAQAPYTEYDQENKVEKAAVQLMGFEKTGLLQPGDSETVAVTVPLQWLASYDYTNAKGYIMDAGDYYFSIGDDAHEAVNNILAAKGKTVADGMTAAGDSTLTYMWHQDALDTETYHNSLYTGVEVTNAFDDVDLNYWMDAGNQVTYLTRSDWEGTFPQALALTASQSMLSNLNDTKKYEHGTNDVASRITVNEQAAFVDNETSPGSSEQKVIALKGLAYDDAAWDDLLNELTLFDMSKMVAEGRYTIPAVPTVSFPEAFGDDNPTGLWKPYIYSAIDPVTGEGIPVEEGMTISDGITDDQTPVSDLFSSMYCSEPTLAATFNKELAARQGDMFAEDGLYTGMSFTWGMGANIHRTPYGGRAAEYFSSDSIHSALMGAEWTKAAWQKGQVIVVKHLVLNEQETNRSGVATFTNEQALRENYLRAFEGLAAYGDLKGVMATYNRIGLLGTASEYDLMTTVLRNEWGSDCYAITDLNSPVAGLYDGNAMIAAGTSIILNSGSFNATSGSSVSQTLSPANIKADATLLTATREACHRMLYVFVNSVSMNGVSSTAQVVTITPWYQTVILVCEVVFTISAVVCTGLYLISANKKQKGA